MERKEISSMLYYPGEIKRDRGGWSFICNEEGSIRSALVSGALTGAALSLICLGGAAALGLVELPSYQPTPSSSPTPYVRSIEEAGVQPVFTPTPTSTPIPLLSATPTSYNSYNISLENSSQESSPPSNSPQRPQKEFFLSPSHLLENLCYGVGGVLVLFFTIVSISIRRAERMRRAERLVDVPSNGIILAPASSSDVERLRQQGIPAFPITAGDRQELERYNKELGRNPKRLRREITEILASEGYYEGAEALRTGPGEVVVVISTKGAVYPAVGPGPAILAKMGIPPSPHEQLKGSAPDPKKPRPPGYRSRIVGEDNSLADHPSALGAIIERDRHHQQIFLRLFRHTFFTKK